MTIPTSSFQLVFYLALLVPGVVFAAARVQLRGPRAADRSVAARVLEAIVASAIFDSIYAALFSDQLSTALQDVRGYVAENIVPVTLVFLVGGVVLPYLVAWTIYGKIPILERPSRLWREKVRPAITGSQEASDTPTAWDYGNKAVTEGWVRIRIAEGVWVGGVFDERSRFSTYPESRDLFIAEQWNVDKAGRFESRVIGSQGLWLAVRDEYVVEWLQEEEDSHGIEQERQKQRSFRCPFDGGRQGWTAPCDWDSTVESASLRERCHAPRRCSETDASLLVMRSRAYAYCLTASLI